MANKVREKQNNDVFEYKLDLTPILKFFIINVIY